MASPLSTGLQGSSGRGGSGGYQQSGPSSPGFARRILNQLGGQIKGFGNVPAALVLNGLRIQAKASGSGGESITVAVTNGSPTNNQALSVTVSTNAITVHTATDGSGNAISSAADIRDAINATGASSALVSAAVVSGDGTQVVPVTSATALAGDVNVSIGTAGNAKLPRQHPIRNSYV